jgi:hypothetical protein
LQDGAAGLPVRPRPLDRLGGGSRSSGEDAPPGQCAAQGQFVGELEVRAHRQAGGQTGHHEVGERAEQSREVGAGRFPGGVGVGGDDDFRDLGALELLAHASHQSGDPQLVGPDPVDGIERAAEDVIVPVELAGPLDGLDVLGFADDTHDAGIPSRIGADPAALGGGDGAADLAVGDTVDDGLQCRSEAFD